ncbi:YybH family protein [Lutimonas sp.]|uniref:YybH family protein n=1 Tax=Lutimonas sp. TaxID=1872403 RepID=UPI003D9B867B
MNRNKILKIVLMTIFVTLFSSCRVDQNPSNETEKQMVKKTLIDMWSAIEQGDIEKYAAYVHPDFTQFGETDSIMRIGKEAEIKGINSWIQNSENIHTEMEDPRITVKNDVAWIVYYWKDHGITNGEAFATRGKSTRIFVKENGKWLCIHGHYTSLP